MSERFNRLPLSIFELTISKEKYENGFQLYPVNNLTALCENGFMQKCVYFTHDYGECQPDGWSSSEIVWYEIRL